MNNIDMNKLVEMLSKMDKAELEKGLAQAAKVLNSNNKDEILKKLNNNKWFCFMKGMI